MTEVELLSSLYEWNSIVIADISLYMTILLSYFVAAHLPEPPKIEY
jgi:hypothetical protein